MNLKYSKPKQIRAVPRIKYSFNSKLYDFNVRASFDDKIGATRTKQLGSVTFPDKIKSNPSFSLEKGHSFNENLDHRGAATSKKQQKQLKLKERIRLPQIRKSLGPSNPEQEKVGPKRVPQDYYQSKIYRALKLKQNTYMMNLARQHFLQNVQGIKVGKTISQGPPKEIKLPKRNPKFKTIFLDLDETLIHCDEASTNYTVKLNFPIEGGGSIAAGIRVRPFCHEFIRELSSFAEVIIFTASASSYADVILDYLDPNKKFFAHRLYRNHCTLEKGFYTKDLRIVNRRPEDVAIVDNSAFSYMVQPQFGIPVLPFYHFAKDKELAALLEYLRKLVQEEDMRQKIREDFFWHLFRKGDADPRKIFQQYFQK